MENKYNYDREGWKELEGEAWEQVKKFVRVTLTTMLIVVTWIAVQPIRVFQWARHRWYLAHMEEIMIEQESEIRFKNMMETGHI